MYYAWTLLQMLLTHGALQLIPSSSDQQSATSLCADHKSMCHLMFMRVCVRVCVFAMLPANSVMLCITLQATCSNKTLCIAITTDVTVVLYALL